MRLWVLLIAVISAYPFGVATAQPKLASSSQTSAAALAEEPVREWVRLLNAGRWDSLATLTTQDFLMVKGTEQVTVADLVRSARGEGIQSITGTIDSLRTWVVGDIAYSQYRAHVRFTANNVEGSVEEIGTQVMRREKGTWKLSFWHLTQLDTPQRQEQ